MAQIDKPKLLFVDDDRYFTDRYVSHLSKSFSVRQVQYASDVLAAIESDSDIRLLILDIMMPTPDGVAASATDDGMDTGLWLVQEARQLIAEKHLPVLLYTNRKDIDVIKERLESIGVPSELTRVCVKRRVGASDLPDVATKFLRDSLNAGVS